MPVTYHRDDARHLITVTVTDPRSLEDICAVVDRQAAEGTWHYALFYDLTHSRVLTEAEGQQVRDHVRRVVQSRPRGPVAVAIAPRADEFRRGLYHSRLYAGLVDIEVLLNAEQIEAWHRRWASTVKAAPVNERHG